MRETEDRKSKRQAKQKSWKKIKKNRREKERYQVRKSESGRKWEKENIGHQTEYSFIKKRET